MSKIKEKLSSLSALHISLGVLLILIVVYIGYNYRMSSNMVKEKLADYMQAVYAPQDMEQFYKAKEDSRKIFTPSVTERFFVAYTDKLSEADLQRVCETYIVYGEAENQIDKTGRYLVTAYLYSSKNSDPIIKDFVFIEGKKGKITDFKILEHIE